MGRHLATEFDLLFRMRALNQGSVRNDSRHVWRSWEEFDRALVITPACGDPEWRDYHQVMNARVAERAAQVGSEMKLIRALEYPPGEFCLKEYALSQNVQE